MFSKVDATRLSFLRKYSGATVMFKRRIAALLLFSLLCSNSLAFAQDARPAPKPDPNDPIQRIRDEGLNRSQVMQTLNYLTDVIGPRLTGSPQMKRANEWTRDKLGAWGLVNNHLEAWGPFGRGWALKRFTAEVIEPQVFPIIAYPKAWSPGFGATPFVGEVVYVDAKDEAELQKFKGTLRGKIVLTAPIREVKAHFEPEGERMTEKQLLDLANAPDPATRPQTGRFRLTPEQRALRRMAALKLNFFEAEGAALLVDPGRGDGGTVFVGGASVPQPLREEPAGAPAFGPDVPRSIQARDKDAPKFAPQIVMAAEHYNRIVRMLQAGEKVRLSFNFDVQFFEQDLMGYNTIAEIRGNDPQLKDEVVMLGGHLDSWHGGTGATDNAAGCAVAMEAVRIIQTLGLKPRRTVRIALWTGEEQGLLGSREYVKQHFGELVPVTPAATGGGTNAQTERKLVTKPEHEKLSAYYNLDNGTGKIRGVYMQGNASVWPIFREWLAPFNDLGAQTLTMSNTGGTDHLAFDGVGLPGFQFIQDEVEYDTRTHHSNMDVFDRIQADDMKQASVVMAAFVYQTAMRNEKIPRKPQPGRPSGTTRTSTETVSR
jgi:hypothetical protein